MSRLEYLSPEGLRLDGRRPNELRGITAKPSALPQVDGSAIFQLGNTRILATVYGPREPRQKGHSHHEKATVTARFHAATFSSVGGERRRQQRQDRRLNEWGRYIEEIYECAIITSLFPRSQIEIYIEVLNADGSVLPSAINAVTLALIDAGIPLYDYVVACSVGYLSKSILLDLNRLEEGGSVGGLLSAPNITVAAYGRQPASTLFMTGDNKIGGDQLESMTEMAKLGIKKIFEELDLNIVRPMIEELAKLRNIKAS